tara:strand:+ start:274 stop:579 length:306 start_codon:yes stop_codon:yes gene_type:complete
MLGLRASAKVFTPGAKEHIIKKLSWHILGVTQVKYFQVENEPSPSFPKGRRLVGVPASGIKNSTGIEATPFLIPPNPEDYQPEPIVGLVRPGPRRLNYCDN